MNMTREGDALVPEAGQETSDKPSEIGSMSDNSAKTPLEQLVAPRIDASKTQIRLLVIDRDMDEVLKIERSSFQYPWTDIEFRGHLLQPNTRGIVAEMDHRILGVVIYEVGRPHLRICNFAVAEDVRRNGIGREMVQRLQKKMPPPSEISLIVRETNVIAQLFFKSCGFRATDTFSGCYTETAEDAYLMQWQASTAPTN